MSDRSDLTVPKLTLRPRSSNVGLKSKRGLKIGLIAQGGSQTERTKASGRVDFVEEAQAPFVSAGRSQLVLPYDAPEKARRSEARPFLKWVGGKAGLLVQFDTFLPASVERYCEPFVGGGAVFFHLRKRFPHMKAFLRDNNPELVATYQAVRDHPAELMRRLDEHLACYLPDRNGHYYAVRRQHHLTDTVERAARMIFLNKTCFNGLWRVNARGEFNVPIGSHKNPSLYDRENIEAASFALRDTDIVVQDFRETLKESRRGDFVYIDPPYHPVSLTANFTSYTKGAFGPKEQHELSAHFAEAAQRGVRLMLSNSDAPLIHELYQGFQIHIVQARRAINSDGAKRGAVNEVVVCAGD